MIDEREHIHLMKGKHRASWLSTFRLPAGFALWTLLIAPIAHATMIQIDPGPAPDIASFLSVSFNDLDGTALQGQTISLDFDCINSKFIRLFSGTDSSFATLLTLQTGSNSLVGFLQGTGYFVDQNGYALENPLTLGSASGSDGSMTAGLFPLQSLAVQRPIDLFGIHLDLQLPSTTSVSITGGQIEFVTPGARRIDRFGIGPGLPADLVPDSGFTGVLLTVSLAGLLAIRRCLPLAS